LFDAGNRGSFRVWINATPWTQRMFNAAGEEAPWNLASARGAAVAHAFRIGFAVVFVLI
jgi:hypothetical protein